jgi:thiol-disulfide isomerase/thioredoxin
MINFNDNFYGLSVTTWLIIGTILLVILYIVFFYKKSITENSEKFKNSNELPTTIYNFNTSWCGWSTKFQPEWEDFSNLVDADPSLRNITVIDVKCDKSENEAKCKEYEVEGFPTVIIEVGDKVGTYKGARTAKDLIETVRNLEPPV